jgi:putative permease
MKNSSQVSMDKPKNILREWYDRYVSDPQMVILVVLLVAGFLVMLTFGKMLAPVLAGIVIAYLLDGLVEKCREELPKMIIKGHELLLTLPEKYPNLFTEVQVGDLIAEIRADITAWGQRVLTLSLPAVFGLMSIMVYLILVPVLAFFFLKDKDRIIDWFSTGLPKQRRLVDEVALDVNRQVANYVRGKVWEIVIVGAASYVTFTLMGLNYALLLATIVGLSVIIPYIGAAVVTVPVALIAWFQWGWSADFGWLMFAYGVLQALDGYLLVPLLFSEVVNLHPVAIIIAILVFGGLWGFWGVFFAIPLATLVNAVLHAWSGEGSRQNAIEST